MNNFEKNVITTWGDAGAAWLKQLPELQQYFTKRWQLSELKPMHNLSYNYVVSAHSTIYQSDVVLKISMSDAGFFNEIKALQYFAGIGCVKLLAHDTQKGGMLLEAFTPGTTVKTLFPHEDTQSVVIVANAIKQLHHSKKSFDLGDYPTVEEWLNALTVERNSDISARHIQKAQTLAKQLLATQQEFYVLHGDLHHDNILFDANRSWVAIDPKGVIGPLEYEVGALIRGPMPALLGLEDSAKIIAVRIEQFSTLLRLDRQRIIDWSYVQAILAACWSHEGQDGVSQWLQCAEIIETLL